MRKFAIKLKNKHIMETNEKNVKPAEQKKEEQLYHCNDCGGVIYKHQIFCDNCGKKLDHYDFED